MTDIIRQCTSLITQCHQLLIRHQLPFNAVAQPDWSVSQSDDHTVWHRGQWQVIMKHDQPGGCTVQQNLLFSVWLSEANLVRSVGGQP